MVNAPKVVVLVESPREALAQAAADLARRLHVPLCLEPKEAMDTELVLGLGDDGLELREFGAKPGGGLRIDFSALRSSRATPRGGFSRRQPLARAIGRDADTVLDLTAGLGHDAALLACMGYRVTAIERSAIIYELLRDGLRRAIDDPELRQQLGAHLEIINAEARDVLRSASAAADAIYIDPMFPPKRKESALAKKEVRMVRRIVGDDEDAAELLRAARGAPLARRVVVKRPTYAPPLAPRPTASIKGKLVRYDLYVRA